MWFLLMIVMLALNGMSAFGLKVIAAWGLPEAAKFSYLTVWYAAGFVLIAVTMLMKGSKVRLKELGWGSFKAIFSIIAQVAMAIALNSKVPGNIVFPVTTGGAILVVGVAGRLFFGERMNRLTRVGIVLGASAVVLLSIS
jgi:multidrug transporter EmrE-like cation transporter